MILNCESQSVALRLLGDLLREGIRGLDHVGGADAELIAIQPRGGPSLEHLARSCDRRGGNVERPRSRCRRGHETEVNRGPPDRVNASRTPTRKPRRRTRRDGDRPSRRRRQGVNADLRVSRRPGGDLFGLALRRARRTTKPPFRVPLISASRHKPSRLRASLARSASRRAIPRAVLDADASHPVLAHGVLHAARSPLQPVGPAPVTSPCLQHIFW